MKLHKIKQAVKNYIGDHREFRRCPVTQDTLWNEQLVHVPYTYDSEGKPMQSVAVLKKAFASHSPEEIVKIVLSNRYRKHYTFEENIYTLEKCMAVFMDSERGVVYSIPSRKLITVGCLTAPIRRLTVQGMPSPPSLQSLL